MDMPILVLRPLDNNASRKIVETAVPDLKCAIPLQVDTVMSEFAFDEIKKSKRSIIFVTNDLQVFFNQQRLAKLGQGALDHVAEIARKRNLTQKYNLTDDQIIAGIKSKYIQSVGDVYRYVQYSESAAQSFVDDFERDLSKNTDPAPAGDPAPSGDPV